MALVDFPRLLPEQYLSYALGRGFVILSLLGVLIALKLEVNSSVLIATGWLSYLFYVAHGQFYSPGYFLGYYEGVIALTFLFEISAGFVQVLLAFGALVFGAALYLSPAAYVPVDRFRADVLIGIFIVNALGFFTHRYIGSERHARQELYRRFADLGKHSAMMIHDLKGMMSSPILCSQLLERQLKEHPDQRVQSLMTKLSRDLESLRDFAMERNRMTLAEHRNEPIRMSSAIQEACRLLGSRMAHVRLIIDGDLELKSNGDAAVRCILNIFSNSLDAFREKSVKAPEIYISCDGGTARFEDNAGGYQGAVLNELRKGRSSTTKANGTGLGSMIISDHVRAMGGRAKFANGSRGAVVTLEFNNSIFDRFKMRSRSISTL